MNFDDIFAVTIPFQAFGFREGDTFICSRTKTPGPNSIVILLSDGCPPWPMVCSGIQAEIRAGAVIMGTAILLTRDLTLEEEDER